MSVKPNRVPKYRQHPNGQAFIEYRRRRHYLGKFNSEESHLKYRQLVNEILGSGFIGPAPIKLDGTAQVDECILQYMIYAEGYYGAKTAEFGNMRTALRDLSQLFGQVQAAKFGPRSLSQLREHWIRRGWSRPNINHQVGRIRRFFRWCGSQELIPGEIAHRLTCLDPLRAGRSLARETKKVKPAKKEHVERVLEYVSPTIAAMIQVQYLCGMRPSDVCEMQGSQIDMKGEVWLYHVAQHKNTWREQVLIKAIPARAQAILRPFIEQAAGGYLFRPENAVKSIKRKLGKRKSKAIRDHYDRDSYRQAVNYGFAKAARRGVTIERWHPNQLRHLIATEISQTLGQQSAQRWLGHSDLDTTAIYAEKEVSELIAIAQELDRRWAS